VTAIRANSILPARRTDIELQTADGVTLVGEVALPADRDPVATIVCLHPLPTHGGMMDSHVFRKAAWRLPALAGVAVVRFNSRGTASVRGTSGGEFDGGVAERYDVAAAIEYAEFAGLPSIWLVGWSFGTDLALKYGCDPSVVGASRRRGISPSGMAPASRWSRSCRNSTTTSGRPRPARSSPPSGRPR
jgi:uncharacterized protein